MQGYPMVVHIVLFKFKEENRQANMIQAKQMLEDLMGAVPSLRSIDVGINFSKEERAMDMSIITSFESKEGLEAYAVHPEHLKVIDFIKQVVEYTKVVDYERE
jgi:hypothetical protein